MLTGRRGLTFYSVSQSPNGRGRALQREGKKSKLLFAERLFTFAAGVVTGEAAIWTLAAKAVLASERNMVV